MALLSLFIENKTQLKINNLYAFHLNHGLRGEESDSDERLVADYCHLNGITLFTEHAEMLSLEKPKGMSLEQWAREIRYDYFEAYAKRFDCLIATAHSLNDRAETLLFQLSRGSGISGAKSIPPVRGRIIRPLIETSRKEIEGYCLEKQISYATDSTNSDVAFSRNRIRHAVLPELEVVNAAAIKNLGEFCDRCLLADAFIEKCARQLLTEAAVGNGYDCNIIYAADRAVANEALRMIICQYCSQNSATIERCFAALKEEQCDIQLSDRYHYAVSHGVVCVKEPSIAHESFCVEAAEGNNIIPGGKTLELLTILEFPCNCIDFIKNKSLNDHIDCGKIKGKLYIRSKRDGESFKSNRTGHTKAVKKIFNELRIPPEQRNIYPVLADDLGILWILGVGVASRAAVDQNTKSAYYIKIKK